MPRQQSKQQIWTVIRFVRTRKLRRFTVFKNHTWETWRSVGECFELGASELWEGRDYEVIYRGPRRDFDRHLLVHETEESRQYYGVD